MESNRKDVAKKYILYREKRSDIRKSKWQMDELQKSIWTNKYQYNNESFDDWIIPRHPFYPIIKRFSIIMNLLMIG